MATDELRALCRMLAKKRKSAQQTLSSFAGFSRKAPSRSSPIHDIPSRILQYYVFSRLSSKELSRVCSVSRKWKELASPHSFLPYSVSYQRLKCGSEPILSRAVFPASFESLMQFDPHLIADLGHRALFLGDGCVDFVFDSVHFSGWMRLMVSLFTCENPARLVSLLSSFPHGSSLELISFLLSCNLITPCCFGRFSHRSIYLFENHLNCLTNESCISAQSYRIPNSSDRGFFSSFKKHVPSKPFTLEQRALVEMSFGMGRVVLASCFAGCGKTSTLVEYALARPSMRILYLCFNKSAQLHACSLFPQTNVCCRTLHSLAWESSGSRYRHKLQPSLRCSDVMRVMSVSALAASAARTVVLNFLSSSDDQILASHSNCITGGDVSADQACELASKVWGKMRDVQDLSLPMLHSGYLKIYASHRPVLDYDLIMVDEAQDCDPVTMQARSPAASCVLNVNLIYLQPFLQVISYQKVPKIFVGDSHQQIYQFRGAVDAMKRVDAVKTVHLNQTFRFGA